MQTQGIYYKRVKAVHRKCKGDLSMQMSLRCSKALSAKLSRSYKGVHEEEYKSLKEYKQYVLDSVTLLALAVFSSPKAEVLLSNFVHEYEEEFSSVEETQNTVSLGTLTVADDAFKYCRELERKSVGKELGGKTLVLYILKLIHKCADNTELIDVLVGNLGSCNVPCEATKSSMLKEVNQVDFINEFSKVIGSKVSVNIMTENAWYGHKVDGHYSTSSMLGELKGFGNSSGGVLSCTMALAGVGHVRTGVLGNDIREMSIYKDGVLLGFCTRNKMGTAKYYLK